MIVRGARDVARATRAGAGRIDGFIHRRQHLGMLTHAEVVVAAPDRDRTGVLLGMVKRLRVAPAPAYDVCKYPVSALALQAGERVAETGNIGKSHTYSPQIGPDGPRACRPQNIPTSGHESMRIVTCGRRFLRGHSFFARRFQEATATTAFTAMAMIAVL